jgi:hypothetical protein
MAAQITVVGAGQGNAGLVQTQSPGGTDCHVCNQQAYITAGICMIGNANHTSLQKQALINYQIASGVGLK